MFIFLAALVFLMLLVIFFDATRYVIPNWLNGLVGVLYIPMVLTAPVQIDWVMALAAAGIVFAVGYIIFLLRWMGGGDVKLLTVLALWVGWAYIIDFVVVMALFGGLLSVALVVGRKILPFVYTPKEGKTLPRILQMDGPVPYGLAIAAAFFVMLWIGEVPGVVEAPPVQVVVEEGG